jgi:tetratricopeptide (TPR) repeat protein
MTSVVHTVPDPVNSSAGGARAASGLSFQAEVFAWWAAHAVSGIAPGLGLGPDVRVEVVGCETGFPVDDVGVALSGGGFILVQAKVGMRRLAADAQDFRMAMGQLVSAMTGGLRSGIPLRPVDVARDRLVIATDVGSSGSFNDLGTVCGRLRDLPAEVSVEAAAKTVDQRKCLKTLLEVIGLTWVNATGRLPAKEEMRKFLRALEVIVFDFQTEAGRDFIRCDTLLQHARVPRPVSVLTQIGLEAAKTQTWRQRDALAAVLRWDDAQERSRGTASKADAVPDAVFQDPGKRVVVGNIPQPPPAFQPRENLLRLLRSAAPPVVRSVTGMRCVGKTQVAAAYARECIDTGWRLVAWVNAGNPATVQSDLALVASELGIGQPGMTLNEIGKLVRGRLEADGDRCLLVFDDVNYLESLRDFIPAAGKAHVVLTSSNTLTLGSMIPVDVFTNAEAMAFLADRAGRNDPYGEARLANELGCLPLALAQAAAIIAAQRLTYETYLSRLLEFPLADYLLSSEDDSYPFGLAESILLSLSGITTAGQAGVCEDLLSVISLLSPAGVTRDLLYTSVFATASPAEVDAALGQLSRASLLTFSANGTTVTAHRMVMRVIRERCAHDNTLPLLAVLACELLKLVGASLDEPWQNPLGARDFVSHVTALHDHLAPILGDNDAVVEALLDLRGSVLSVLCQLGDSGSQAVELGESLVADRTRILGRFHPETVTARHNLAGAYQDAGRLQDSVHMFEQVLADQQRVLNHAPTSTLRSRNNLAVAYGQAGRLEDSVRLLEQVLVDHVHTHGRAHRDTLASQSNLAEAYRMAGRTEDAIRLLERSSADQERILGAACPDTLASRNDLALAYTQARRIEDAVRLNEQVLADRERVLGDAHPDTLASQNNLALAYYGAGRLKEAIRRFEQALSGAEQLLGPDHPSVATTRKNLAIARRQAEEQTNT